MLRAKAPETQKTIFGTCCVCARNLAATTATRLATAGPATRPREEAAPMWLRAREVGGPGCRTSVAAACATGRDAAKKPASMRVKAMCFHVRIAAVKILAAAFRAKHSRIVVNLPTLPERDIRSGHPITCATAKALIHSPSCVGVAPRETK